MPALAEPPAIDPTPGPGDVTSFEQVAGGPPARHPTAPAPKPSGTPATPAPAKDEPQRHGTIPDDILSGLDELPTTDEQGRPKAAPEPNAEAKPAVAATDELDEPATTPETPAPTEADLEKQVQAFKTLKEIRAAHKDSLKRERELRKEQSEWKAKLEASELRLKSVPAPETLKATQAELESAKKRTAELEEQVKTLDYTRSTEFHEKYVKPQAKALESAYADLNELTVTDTDGNTRKATESDFKRLLSMDVQKAGEEARAKFGEFAAPEIMAHRRAVLALERAKREAIDGAGKASEEAQARQTAEQTARQERLTSVLKARTTELEEKHPNLFKPREGDEEGNKTLQKGIDFVKMLELPDLDDESRVKLGAEVRMRAIGYGRLLLDHRRLQAKLVDAEKKLKAYENGGPRDGDGGPIGGRGEEPKDPMERAMKGLDALTPLKL